MGLKPWELRRITYSDYCDMTVGDLTRRFEKMEFVRSIETAIVNYGGMGSTKQIKPKDLYTIPLIDNRDVIIPIRTKEKALELLKTFDAWLGYR